MIDVQGEERTLEKGFTRASNRKAHLGDKRNVLWQADAGTDMFGGARKQQAQARAQNMARELVGAVLDIQLRQLAENGMDELPIYREVRLMRENIDGLVAEEMQSVIKLLEEAQQGTVEHRRAKFSDARGEIRTIVVALMAERQKLLKRMQMARLAA